MKKMIIKDKEKFYKKIWLYRTFLYKNTIFQSNIKELKQILKALNIKKRKERIKYIYDEVCDELLLFHKVHANICQFINNQCITQRNSNSKLTNGCCRRCKFQSVNGCPQKNMSCLFHFCKTIKKKHDVPTISDIKLLKLFSWRQRVIIKYNYFTPYKQYITDLYIGSLIVFFIRRWYRYIFISDIIFKFKKEN